MKRFEYITNTTPFGRHLTDDLNFFGNKGWEAIHFETTRQGTTTVLKREVDNDVKISPAVSHNHSIAVKCWVTCPHRGTPSEILTDAPNAFEREL